MDFNIMNLAAECGGIRNAELSKQESLQRGNAKGFKHRRPVCSGKLHGRCALIILTLPTRNIKQFSVFSFQFSVGDRAPQLKTEN
jgi:hypothetical protein